MPMPPWVERVRAVLRRRREVHRITTRDLDAPRAILPEDHPVLQELEKAPQYLCSCGKAFYTFEEANQHRIDALQESAGP